MIFIESGDRQEHGGTETKKASQFVGVERWGDNYYCSSSAGWFPSPPQIVLNHPHYI